MNCKDNDFLYYDLLKLRRQLTVTVSISTIPTTKPIIEWQQYIENDALQAIKFNQQQNTLLLYNSNIAQRLVQCFFE